MLNQICRHLRNFFPIMSTHEGHFTIEDSKISLPFCNEGEYFVVEGSMLNDGIYCYSTTNAMFEHDEEFDGIITVRAVPSDFIALVNEISTYKTANAPSNFTSESFGGYSYSKATGTNGAAADWQTVFRERLAPWRKL